MSGPISLGIDIAKETFDVALGVGGALAVARFANRKQGFAQLTRWLARHDVGQVHACLEATGRYGEALAEALYTAGHIVSVVKPARIRKYADSRLQRHKTDAQDALVILDFCRTQHPRPWTPPAAVQRELQEMVRYHAQLQTMRQQEVNRRQSGLRSPTVRRRLQQHITTLQRHITTLASEIHALIASQPHLRRQAELLGTIPGIGPLTAARLLAEIGDVAAFDSAKQLAAYAGLTPAQHQAGRTVRRARLSKMGRSQFRTFLYMPALTAARHNPLIVAFTQRLLAQGKPKMLVITAAMRKLLHIVYGVLKSGRPFDPSVGHINLQTP